MKRVREIVRARWRVVTTKSGCEWGRAGLLGVQCLSGIAECGT
jgi:hypothetical protein